VAPLHPPRRTVQYSRLFLLQELSNPRFFADTSTTKRYKQVLESDFIPFLQGMGVQFDKRFFLQDAAPQYTHQMTFWISFVCILVIVSFRIASLNVLAMDGLGHHILLTSTLAITFCGSIWRTVCTETITTQLTRWQKKSSCSYRNHCQHYTQSSGWFSASTTNDTGCRRFTYWTCFPLTDYFPKSTVLINTKIIPVHQILKKNISNSSRSVFILTPYVPILRSPKLQKYYYSVSLPLQYFPLSRDEK
jgi:hypothetical protein